MDRATELRHLAEAERHVFAAEHAITRQEEWLEAHARGDPAIIHQAEELLTFMREAVRELVEHRAFILRSIADFNDPQP